MNLYDDGLIALDDEGIVIKSYGRPGSERRIGYGEVRDVRRIPLGFWTGRARLVGMGPGRPLHFFHWDPKRGQKSEGIRLDLGRVLKTVITPEDAERVEELVAARVG